MKILKEEKQILTNEINPTAFEGVNGMVSPTISARNKWLRENEEQFSFYFLQSITAAGPTGQSLLSYSVKWTFRLTLGIPEHDVAALEQLLEKCNDQFYNELALLTGEYTIKLKMAPERHAPFSLEKLLKGMQQAMESEPLPLNIRKISDQLFDNQRVVVETKVIKK
ncbi:hypothetical protein C8P68_101279 [Mucilaginibacter yixingensis]|uniref:Uncharacterized protein n=1 Tax=Mucilaginibacter yixingensis TaxID=1295612 RepID=A0A2T5JF36_9SPHI|nr:hypothetical protein [Mucilaginibacter yixingensis]PTR01048.1 hypothetical protein C8P68_101279 [Mucilaginibacter yixingensis]